MHDGKLARSRSTSARLLNADAGQEHSAESPLSHSTLPDVSPIETLFIARGQHFRESASDVSECGFPLPNASLADEDRAALAPDGSTDFHVTPLASHENDLPSPLVGTPIRDESQYDTPARQRSLAVDVMQLLRWSPSKEDALDTALSCDRASATAAPVSTISLPLRLRHGAQSAAVNREQGPTSLDTCRSYMSSRHKGDIDDAWEDVSDKENRDH